MDYEKEKGRDREIIKQIIKIFADNNLSVVDADYLLKILQREYYSQSKIIDH